MEIFVFRNVTFPGSFLHSHPPGFTAVQLIEANIGERRIFSCGGGLLAAGEDPAIFRSSFHVQTFGICSEITSKLNATWNQLKLAFDCLMNFKQEKFPLTSWDNAVLKHVQLRKIGLFHAIYDFVFHNFQRNEVNFNYLLVAVKLFDTIEESLKNNQVYRRASDIFGWLSRIQPDPYESYMFKTLKKIAETGKDDAIESFIKNRENPYLMQRTM
ncbi:hypothetical protein BVRB_022620 [Beta vulgaris subsp. vulgaris]|uniref:Uncharacterized protein n=1 Tax=Beta vulgaris subsp. vulgaris TaxID=3555 RepID=A0A0J8B393_BETVV|nr:hypothetical protein BVRB_022620 [Beta vulgaris subsp. vulgaris]